MRRVEEEGLRLQVIHSQGPELARGNIRGHMQPIVIFTRQLCTTFVVVGREVEAAPAELCHWSEEAGKGNPTRIHVEVVGGLPKEFCLYADCRSGDGPFSVGVIALECRNDPLYQPGMRFRRRRLQLGAGCGVGLEFLALLDAERKEHAQHLEVTHLHGLLADHSGKTVVEAVVVRHDGVVDYVGRVYETRLRRIAGLAQWVNLDLLRRRARPFPIWWPGWSGAAYRCCRSWDALGYSRPARRPCSRGAESGICRPCPRGPDQRAAPARCPLWCRRNWPRSPPAARPERSDRRSLYCRRYRGSERSCRHRATGFSSRPLWATRRCRCSSLSRRGSTPAASCPNSPPARPR